MANTACQSVAISSRHRLVLSTRATSSDITQNLPYSPHDASVVVAEPPGARVRSVHRGPSVPAINPRHTRRAARQLGGLSLAERCVTLRAANGMAEPNTSGSDVRATDRGSDAVRPTMRAPSRLPPPVLPRAGGHFRWLRRWIARVGRCRSGTVAGGRTCVRATKNRPIGAVRWSGRRESNPRS
jgi:hypothetical protein